MSQDKDINQLKNRFRDLAQRSYEQGIYTFSDFLGIGDQDILLQMEQELHYAGLTIFGGYEMAERRIVRFGRKEDFGYEVDFPIVCIHMEPLMAKFADCLQHRDFLGALMNLGIERTTLGDICVMDKDAYLFCEEKVAEYIRENLTVIKHTSVKCTFADARTDFPVREPQREIFSVSSARVDAVIAKLYNLSRSDCVEYFRAQKVYVGGRLCENNSKLLKSNETVTVRGFGKFVFLEELGITKKGKQNVAVAVYR